MKYLSTNPTTGQIMKKFSTFSNKQIEEALKKSAFAFDINRTSALNVRSKRLMALSELLEERKEELAKMITLEMGKPIKEAIAEVSKCRTVCDYYAEHGKTFLEDQQINSPFTQSTIQYAPLGTILGIMPWNFPFWQVFRFAVPALMSGNSVLLKHAPNVPQCAESIEKLFKDAHFPDGLFQNLFLDNEQAGKVIASDIVQGIAFTGSLTAGSIVAQQAGKSIKKTVLELGGNDAFIVLKDANLKEAAEVAVRSRMLNTGQSCIAAKRWIVDKIVLEPFLELVKEKINELLIDDPLSMDTDIGPMARLDLREVLVQQIQKSVALGAEIALGGKAGTGNGYFMQPTILTNVQPNMPAFDEELFGPVATVIEVENERQAVELTNKSKYGLGASLWTTDLTKAARLAKQLQAGSVFINGMVQSNVHLPFGGIKKSGYGRELGIAGLLEFVNLKSIVVQ